jgi:hypothetical protein
MKNEKFELLCIHFRDRSTQWHDARRRATAATAEIDSSRRKPEVV